MTSVGLRPAPLRFALTQSFRNKGNFRRTQNCGIASRAEMQAIVEIPALGQPGYLSRLFAGQHEGITGGQTGAASFNILFSGYG